MANYVTNAVKKSKDSGIQAMPVPPSPAPRRQMMSPLSQNGHGIYQDRFSPGQMNPNDYYPQQVRRRLPQDPLTLYSNQQGFNGNAINSRSVQSGFANSQSMDFTMNSNRRSIQNGYFYSQPMKPQNSRSMSGYSPVTQSNNYESMRVDSSGF